MSFPGRLPSLLYAFAASASAQPGVSQNGVINSASHIPSTLSGGAIARGARFTILGVRLGAPDRTKVAVFNAGTAIPVTTTAVGVGRIEALMPRSAPLGSGSLVVTVDGKASKPFSLNIAASNPGIYSRNGDGWGPGRVDNVGSAGVHAPNSYTNPAHSGQLITVAVTGLGNTNEITAVIGNRTARATRLPSSTSGEERVSVRIPLDAPEGCYVPLYLLPTLTQASNVVTISIRSKAGACNSGPIPRVAGEKIGLIILFRTSFRSERKNTESLRDDLKVMFGAINDQIIEPPLMLLPPPGTCTAYTAGFVTEGIGLVNSIAFSLLAEQGAGLDAGSSLTLTRLGQRRTIGRLVDGVYRGSLGTGGASAKRGADAPFLEPGELTLKGTGGEDLGEFTLKMESPKPFQWTDREQIAVIDRSRGSTVHWQGAADDRLILVVATNVDQISTATGTCICTARASAKELKLPPALLAHVPATEDIPGVPFDQLYVTSIPAKAAVPVKVEGLSGVSVVVTYALGRIVQYR